MATRANGTSYRADEIPMEILPNAAVEEYLDRLVAPLVGLVPTQERLRLKMETGAHLERSIEHAVLTGGNESAAVRLAIHELGEPTVVAREFLDRWYEAGVRGPLYDRFGRATLVAFFRFGLAHSLFSLLLHLRVFLPSEAAYRLPISPAEARRLVPLPIPVPIEPAFPIFAIAFLLLAPIVAGILTGIAAPVRTAPAVYRAMVPIVVFSFCTGSLVLPLTEGIVFAFIEAVFWMPVGAAAASIAACVYRIRRMERAA